jgi:hypothetical protein
MTPLLSLAVYMTIVTWASLLAASLIRAEGWYPMPAVFSITMALGALADDARMAPT